jgi:hypothetical protein
MARRREHDGMGTPPPHAALEPQRLSGAAQGHTAGGRQHVVAGAPLGGLERTAENYCKALGVQGGLLQTRWGCG